MAKIHDILQMLQSSDELRAIRMESHHHNKQMTGAGYLPSMEGIVKTSLSLFQHDCDTAFQLSETSPLSPALSAKNLPGG
jgi:hypothetical protein